MTVTFANVNGGYEFTGGEYGKTGLGRHSVQRYATALGTQADILCLSEVHLESHTSSKMVGEFARSLGYRYTAATALDKKMRSHLDKQFWLGMGILSRYPLLSVENFEIQTPNLTIERDGTTWIMFNKGGQRVRLQTPDGPMDVINFSFPPFHHFKRRVDEPEFSGVRKALVKHFAVRDGVPLVITGDFNNLGVPLEQAFPEVFTAGFRQAISIKSSVVGKASDQIDHILIKPAQLRVVSARSFDIGSDHYALQVEMTRK
ncbi:MAG TPA: endonuclease/exonuclease/phosphatase family protein [Verrucomicrobiae bacterium]|nr:endonuclease/exonuclease/phosphatase family protein [Verrucomicrobiae bacterium]